MIILVFEYEVLKHRIVKSWKLRQRLDELQAILPLAIEDQLGIVKMMKGDIFFDTVRYNLDDDHLSEENYVVGEISVDDSTLPLKADLQEMVTIRWRW